MQFFLHRSFLIKEAMMELVIQSFFLGIGLAMDACAVSMTNGMNENKMRFAKICFISFMFGLFQALMPLIGYFVGHVFIEYIENIIPWIALVILSFLGIKMLIDAFKKDKDEEVKRITFKVIFFQAIATAIDALSVGVTISDYSISNALIAASIIAIVTFIICIGAHYIGKAFGDKFGSKAQIVGGIILIIIGLEIFLKGIL